MQTPWIFSPAQIKNNQFLILCSNEVKFLYNYIYTSQPYPLPQPRCMLFPPTLVMISSAVQMACILYPFPIFLCFELHPHQSPEHAEFFSGPHLKPSVSAIRGQPLSQLRLCSSVSHSLPRHLKKTSPCFSWFHLYFVS